MSSLTRYSTLSAVDQWLLRQCQHVAFGRLTVTVRGGHVHPASGFKIARTQKVAADADNGPRPQLGRADFVLRQEHLDLLRHLRTLPNGTVVTIKVVLGLPASTVDVEEVHNAA